MATYTVNFNNSVVNNVATADVITIPYNISDITVRYVSGVLQFSPTADLNFWAKYQNSDYLKVQFLDGIGVYLNPTFSAPSFKSPSFSSFSLSSNSLSANFNPLASITAARDTALAEKVAALDNLTTVTAARDTALAEKATALADLTTVTAARDTALADLTTVTAARD
ncbi:MAG: hypothetical protein PHQ03_07670, partial [Methylococcales bacterium]|nr:hypothetical protein [Methylococcales bacterium]